jgi:hypothetical protein
LFEAAGAGRPTDDLGARIHYFSCINSRAASTTISLVTPVMHR